MTASTIVRAIDVGYGNTKFTTDDSGSCEIFPSLAPHADPSADHLSFYQRRETRVVRVGEMRFEVGRDTTLFGAESILHGDYIETPQYLALTYGALDAMNVEHIDLLVVGLPVHLLDTRYSRLKQLLQGEHQIRDDRRVSIAEVAVVAQPLGGFISYCQRPDNWSLAQHKTFLIVDPGFFTFDWLGCRGLRTVPGMSGSVECGMSHFLRAIQDQLQRSNGYVSHDLHRIDVGIRTGRFRMYGRQIDLSSHHAAALPLINRAVHAMKAQVGSADQFDAIFLVGGGCKIFEPLIQQAFPSHSVHIADDPVFANVRGFHTIGELLMRRKAAA